MNIKEAFFNLLLVIASGYAMYSLQPDTNPYGYTAAAFSMMHGLLGLIRNLSNDDEDDCNRINVISTSIMEVIPLPLCNIELYLKSSQANMAMIHGLAVIPLLYDMMGKLGDDWDSATETLKDVTLLGNIGSTMYLAKQESQPIYGAIASVAFISRYGSVAIERFVDSIGYDVVLLGNAAIIGLMTYALTQQ